MPSLLGVELERFEGLEPMKKDALFRPAGRLKKDDHNFSLELVKKEDDFRAFLWRLRLRLRLLPGTALFRRLSWNCVGWSVGGLQPRNIHDFGPGPDLELERVL